MAAPSDVTEVMDKQHSFGLNVADKFPFPNLFIGDASLVTRSDADEQLIFHLAFGEAITLQGIKLLAGAGKASEAPKTVKLFANKVAVSFNDVESQPATQVLQLSPADVGPDSIFTPVKQVLFNRITTLSIFIESNQGDEETTTVGGLRIFGKTLGSTTMGQLKKVAEE